jgi:hypothetical protein
MVVLNGIERKSDWMGIDYWVASLLVWYLGDFSLIFFKNYGNYRGIDHACLVLLRRPPEES